MTTQERIAREANKCSLRTAVSKVAKKVYDGLREAGVENFILNDRYIAVWQQRYQLIRSNATGEWTVKEF